MKWRRSIVIIPTSILVRSPETRMTTTSREIAARWFISPSIDSLSGQYNLYIQTDRARRADVNTLRLACESAEGSA